MPEYTQLMPPDPWRDAACLVTGASSGIGAAVARELADHGARLLLTGRDTAALEAVACVCGPGAGTVETVTGDLTDGDTRAELAAAARDRLGGLDLLVHSAGVTMNAGFAELEPTVLRRILEVNFFAVVELTRVLLPELQASRGRILVLSSLTGIVGTPTRTAYAASKHALHGLFGGLRVELRPDGVSVTLACPGYVATPMRERAFLGDGSVQGVDQAAGRRMLSPEQVARRSLAAAARRRRQILMGTETRLARILSIVAPGALDRILARATR